MKEEYKYLTEEIRDAYFLIQDGKVVLVSERMADFYGYSKDELLGMSLLELLAVEERQQLMNETRKILKGNRIPKRYESIGLKKDGTTVPVEVWAWYTQYQSRPAVAGVVMRTSHSNKSRKILEESEWQYKTMIENMPQKIFLKDRNSVYIYCNKNFAQDLGIEPEEICGKTDYVLFPAELADRYQADDKLVIDTGRTEIFEERYIQQKGERTIQTFKSPVRDTKGNVIGVLGVIHDTTEWTKVDEQLQKSTENLGPMFECTPYAVTIMDANAIITQVNDQTLELYGMTSKAELIGKSGLEFVVPNHRERAMHYLQTCLDSGLIIENKSHTTRADGSQVSVGTSISRLEDANGNTVGLIAFARDITNEERLKENQKYYITGTMKALENERKQLARALHDDIIQELIIATHRLQPIIEGKVGRLPKRTQANLEEIRELIERTASEVRRFTTNLRPDILDDMGLGPALTWLTNRFSSEYGIKVMLNVFGKRRRLPPETELILFRIAQEALNNVRKHANISTATVIVKFGAKRITMSISDNGSGFELPDTISHFSRQQKFGLTGIIERVRLLGGTYTIESNPDRGTVIRVETSC